LRNRHDQSQTIALCTGDRHLPFIDEMIVWDSFTTVDGILFDITLHSGAVATQLESYSVTPAESEVVIAAVSALVVKSVDSVAFPQEDRKNGKHKCVYSRFRR
jgi:hypothetical protein